MNEIAALLLIFGTLSLSLLASLFVTLFGVLANRRTPGN